MFSRATEFILTAKIGLQSRTQCMAICYFSPDVLHRPQTGGAVLTLTLIPSAKENLADSVLHKLFPFASLHREQTGEAVLSIPYSQFPVPCFQGLVSHGGEKKKAAWFTGLAYSNRPFTALCGL